MTKLYQKRALYALPAGLALLAAACGGGKEDKPAAQADAPAALEDEPEPARPLDNDDLAYLAELRNQRAGDDHSYDKGRLKRIFRNMSDQQLLQEIKRSYFYTRLAKSGELSDLVGKKRFEEALATEGIGPRAKDSAAADMDGVKWPGLILMGDDEIRNIKAVNSPEGPVLPLTYDNLLNAYFAMHRDLLNDDDVMFGLAGYLACDAFSAAQKGNEFEKADLTAAAVAAARGAMQARLQDFAVPAQWSTSLQKEFGEYDFASNRFDFKPVSSALVGEEKPSQNHFRRGCVAAGDNIPSLFPLRVEGGDAIAGIVVPPETGKAVANRRKVNLMLMGPADFGDMRQSEKMLTGVLSARIMNEVPVVVTVAKAEAEWTGGNVPGSESPVLASWNADQLAEEKRAQLVSIRDTIADLYALGTEFDSVVYGAWRAHYTKHKTPEGFDAKQPIRSQTLFSLMADQNKNGQPDDEYQRVDAFFRGDTTFFVTKPDGAFGCPLTEDEVKALKADLCLRQDGEPGFVLIRGVPENLPEVTPDQYPPEVKAAMARNYNRFPGTVPAVSVKPVKRVFEPQPLEAPRDYIIADYEGVALVSLLKLEDGSERQFVWRPW